MNFFVANWGITLTFLRVRPGSELAVVGRLRSEDGNEHFYKCFGHYDILRVRSLSRVLPIERVPSDPDVYQAVLLTGIAWQTPISTPPLESWPASPVWTISLLKLDPAVLESKGIELELDCLAYLHNHFSQHVFSSLGHSEVVVFSSGESLQSLLDQVTAATQLTVGDICQEEKGTRTGDRPLFAKTLTTPLVSFARVLEPGDFGSLEGVVRPTLRLSCPPGLEEAVVAKFPAPGFVARHSYGRFDLNVTCEEPVEASEYLKHLWSFRGLVPGDALYQTVTEFDGSPCPSRPRDLEPGPRTSEAVQLGQTLSSISMDERLPEKVRRVLTDFLARYLSCDADPHISTEFRDVRGFIKYLSESLDRALEKYEQDYTEFFGRMNVFEQLLEVATEALYQRYASVEAHLQGVPFPVFASAVGFNRVIAAASALVADTYNSALLKERGRIWEGFVSFSEGGFQSGLGDIYTLPVDNVLAPLSWTPITHELGHGAVPALKLNILDPERIREHMTAISEDVKLQWGVAALGTPKMLLWEVFAHWFDLRHFHSDQGAEQFVIHLWRTWIDVPRVWTFKQNYLFRSLVIFMLRDVAAIVRTSVDSDPRWALIRQAWHEMLVMLKTQIPRFVQYASDLTEDDEDLIVTTTFYVGLGFVGKACAPIEIKFKDVKAAIGRQDREASDQSRRLASGEVITRELANPLRVMHHLSSQVGPDSFAASMALILSLANDFRQKQAKRAA